MEDPGTKKRRREAANMVPPEEETEIRRRRSHGCLHIPHDILLSHILPRLPIKTLARFLLVCRSWLSSMVGNRRFLLDHARHASASSSSGRVYIAGRCKIQVLSTCGALIDFPDPCLGFQGQKFDIHSSAHGLLCLRVDAGTDRFIYVCNPLTGDGERITLPEVHEDNVLNSLPVGLAFNPSTSPDFYWLVHPRLQLLNSYSLFSYTFKIFSSRSGQWTRSTQRLKIRTHKLASNPVYAGGILYWYLGECVVLAFSPRDDAAEVVMMPLGEGDVVHCWENFGVWDDRLTSIYTYSLVAHVWVMVEKNRWEMILRVPVGPVFDYTSESLYRRKLPYEGGSSLYFIVAESQPRPPPELSNCFPLPQSRNCGEVFPDMMEQAMLRYDLKTNEVEVVGVSSSKLGRDYWRRTIFSYYNSLVPVPKRLE